MIGRPSDYTEELADRICGELASGKSLKSICDAEDMPCTVTVYRWLRLHEDFRNNYARAREDQAEALADEIQDIADDGRNDWMEDRDKKTGELIGWRENGEAVSRSKLRVDARKWVAAKLKPKKYGEKMDHTLSAPGGGPVETVTRIELVPLSGNRADPAT